MATRSTLVLVNHQPLHASAKQASLPRRQRARRIAVGLGCRDHPARVPETALAVGRVLDARERLADVSAVVDALVDEVEVRRERRVHRGRERGRGRRVDEASLERPPAWRESRGLVDLSMSRTSDDFDLRRCGRDKRTWMRHDPPQDSVESPVQAKLQSVEGAVVGVPTRLVPKWHSLLYSNTAYV